ncbi:MAG TPA: DUF4957 domain-containing protein [bacterium]|nr:DUF4957 domain-containing protein [bacterium]
MTKFYLYLLGFLLLICSSLFAQTVYQVPAGSDAISTAYESAAAGDIIELTSDGGEYIEGNDLVITKGKPVTIRAAAGLQNKPRWTASGGWALLQTADDLTLEGITIDGTIAGGAREVGIRGAEPEWYALKLGYNLKIRNCDFVNFDYAIYGEDSNQLDTLLIDGCSFTHITKQALQFSGGTIAPGQVRHFFCTNSTFWDIGGYALYFQSTAIDASPQAEFVVDHVTIHDAASGNIYPRDIDGAVIKNSIITNSGTSPGTACLLDGPNSRISNLLYNGLDSVTLEAGALESQLANILAGVDPLYASAVSGNFTLMTGSPAIGAGDDGKSLGDPRWWPENNSEYVFVFAGENTLADAVAAAVAGQTVMLVSDSGIYDNTHKMVIDKPLTIRAADGLKQRPVLTSGAADAMFEISAGFTLQGVILDGAQGADSTAIGITNAQNTSGYNLKVLDTDFLNFSDKGQTTGFGIFGVPSSVVDSVLIENCSFAHILDMGISFNDPLTATGSVNVFKVDNCTFWDMNSEAIYVDAFDSKMETKDPEVTINKVTVYDCGSYNLIAHYIDYSVLTNSLVVLPELNTSYAPTKVYGTHSRVENFLYFNTRDIDLSYGATDFQLINVVPQENPGLKDPENGDFSYTVHSPAVLFLEDGNFLCLGAEHWWPGIYVPVNIHWGTKRNSLKGLTITWKNYNQADSIRWGYTEAYEQGSFPGVRHDDYQLGDRPEYLFDYTFPGLKPQSTIYYSFKFNELWGQHKSFTTARDTLATKFSFIVGADCQAGTEEFQKISSMAAAEKADFYINVGDIIDNSLYPGLWEKYYSWGREYLEQTLTYYTHGNHLYYDTESGNAVMNQLVLPGNEKWYSFKQGNTLFICLLSEASLSTQWTWAKNLLAKSDAIWTVVYFHAPFFTSGGHAGEMDAAIPYWWKMFDDYGVDVILNGHDHTYTRSKPINLNVSDSTAVADYGSAAGQGRLQMLVGSFGAATYSEQSGWWVGKTRSAVNYVKFQVDGDKLHFDSIDLNGAVIDSLTLDAKGTRYDRPINTGLLQEPAGLPGEYQLSQNYPNPFNPATKIAYSLPVAGKVALKIYDLLGREVLTLADGMKQPGRYEVLFDAAALPSGLYYYRLQSGSFDQIRKMVFLK